jgi:Zn ribbon nucleic-acid-binding protein
MSDHDPEFRTGRACPECGHELIGGTDFLYGYTIDECVRCGYWRKVPRRRVPGDPLRDARALLSVEFSFGQVA